VARKHLIIGDHHRKPGLDNADTVMLGELIEFVLPDVIVDIGDFADMPSCSSWDTDKASFVSESLAADITAANAGRAILNKHIAKARKRNPRWEPHCVAISGNHEVRLDRLLSHAMYARFRDCIPALDYTGWEFVPFLKPKTIDGVTFMHYLPYGKRAAVADNARLMLRHAKRSIVAGHSHMFDWHQEVDSFGGRAIALQVGCSFLHSEDYNPLSHRYWRGVVVLRDVEAGAFDVDAWSFNRIASDL